MLVCVFFAGGKSSPDMALRLVYIQYRPRLFGKRRIDLHEPGGNVFMYSGFAHAECFGSLPHGRVIVDNIDSNIDRSFFNIIFHTLEKGSPSESFLHSMWRGQSL